MSRAKRLKIKTSILIVVMSVAVGWFMGGCTDNTRAKKWGGTMTEKLPPNTKLVSVTWKEADVWILSRLMLPEEIPQVYEFKESSKWGIVEGKIVIVESKR